MQYSYDANHCGSKFPRMYLGLILSDIKIHQISEPWHKEFNQNIFSHKKKSYFSHIQHIYLDTENTISGNDSSSPRVLVVK